jgi:hypothetical protein
MNTARKQNGGSASAGPLAFMPLLQFRGDSVTKYVLELGRAFAPKPLSADDCAYVRDCIKRAHIRPIVKECFRNSQLIALRDTEHRLTYVEGFCGFGSFPIHHAWLLISGKVVDVTLNTEALGLKPYYPPKLRYLKKHRGTSPTEYYGVRFPVKTVASLMFFDGRFASLFEAMFDDFDL